jgi:hypothetical protein
MTIEVRKAVAINCWDVLVNGNLLERFDKKYQAEECCNRLTREYIL